MGNTTVNLIGSDITTFICERCKIATAVDLKAQDIEVETVTAAVESESVTENNLEDETATFKEVLRYNS